MQISIFLLIIYVGLQAVLKNGTVIDSYNHSIEDGYLQIGTNSTNSGDILLNSSVTINGDVVVGAGGNPSSVIDQKSGVTINGLTYPMLEENTLESITVPTWLSGSASLGSIDASTTITSSGKYDSIDIGAGEKISIDGNVTIYVTDSIRLGNSSELEIIKDLDAENESLTLYLGKDMIIDNGGQLNNATENPHKLTIYGLDTCKKIEFKSSGNFYGAIYAPQADVAMKNAVEVYGSIIADTFTQFAAAGFHYDMSLRQIPSGHPHVKFVAKNWSEQ